MTPERDIEKLQDQAMNHEGRIAALEAFRDNERARHASTPTWLFGVLAAAVSIASLVINMMVQLGGKGP